MDTKNILVGLFDDDHVFLDAIKAIRSEGVRIDDAFMPFPVHGFEEALGMKESKLHVGGFWVGLCGCLFALGFILWANTVSWPNNWGGKPTNGVLAFVPIIFEVTVLTSSIAMFLAFILRNKTWPGKKPAIVDERLTDHMFALTFDLDKLDGKDVTEIKSMLTANGAVEIKESESEKSRLLEIR